MDAELEHIIEHFKGEIEEAIETTLENERKYSEQLGGGDYFFIR